MTPETKEKQSRDCWSKDEQIFFVDGYGYGLTEDLRTICLGQEEDIKKFFETGELAEELNLLQKQVLVGIAEYRKEEGFGQSDISGADMERAGNNGASRRKQKATSLLTPRKRLTLRSSHKKHNRLFS